MNQSVLSLKEKRAGHWFSNFQIARKYIFMTDPLNMIFWQFRYMIY